MDGTKHVVYKVRWLLLAGICIGGFNRQFTATAFAIVNDAVSQYFLVTNYQVDILSIGDTVLAVVVCLILSMFGKSIGLRAQCLIAVSFSAIGNLLTAIAFKKRFVLCSGVILAHCTCARSRVYVVPQANDIVYYLQDSGYF